MTEIVAIIAVFAWLAAAGWSYRVIAEDTQPGGLVAVMIFCLLLAPFCAAATLADKRIRAAKEPSK